MKAVIFHPLTNPPTTDRLVNHIKSMSGVDTLVIRQEVPDPKWLGRPGVQNEAFRYVCSLMDEPFLWLEQDSIPLTPDWFRKIKARWEKRGPKTWALMSSDFQSPHDMIGGIGVYDPRIRSTIPANERTEGFDTWIIRGVPHKVERTQLIQHAYGWYDHRGRATPIEFPRDRWILRDTAVIFHADKKQTLIP
jgi:hypothetical protein